jgi:hypothetical protein
MFFRTCSDHQKSFLKSVILKILVVRNLPTFDTLLAEECPIDIDLFEDSAAAVSVIPTVASY